MGCTASTSIVAGPEQAPTPADARLRRKWQHVPDTTHRQMKFLAVGNGSRAWRESLSNGLESRLLGTSSSHHRHSAGGLEQLKFRRDKVDYLIYHTGDTATFSLYDEAFFTKHFDVLVFCVSLAGYDQVLTAPNGVQTNETDAALEQFDYLCNSKQFRKLDVILYFTDIDEFERKLQASPAARNRFFQEYQGGMNLQEALLFFANKFRNRVESRSSRGLFMHLVKNPESSILSFVDATKTIILTSGLVRSGFLNVDDDDSDMDFALSGLDISSRTGTTATDTSQVPSFVSF